MQPFVPLTSNRHFQTIAGHFWRRPPDSRYPMDSRLYRTEPEVEVLVVSQQPQQEPRGHVVLVHGLEGSGAAGYMRSVSYLALEAGFAAHRFHMRTCGGTEHLCQTLYHAGLTSDLRSVLEQFAAEGMGPVWLVGFSLGGNVVMKLAGELGEQAGRLMRGVCAVSPSIDLLASVVSLELPENRLYQSRFVNRMRERLRNTGRYRREQFAGVRTLRDIDERFTAPAFGFQGASDYYVTQSATRVVSAISVPTLVIHANDDPLVPSSMFESDALRQNPWIRLFITQGGGHLGFLARNRPRLWMDHAVIEWISEESGTIARKAASTA
jgi:predicted alpha/beta-fold hydrolase